MPYLKLEVNELPNIKGAIKRVKQSAAANEQNSNTKHAMRTAVRKAEVALDAKAEDATSPSKRRNQKNGYCCT